MTDKISLSSCLISTSIRFNLNLYTVKVNMYPFKTDTFDLKRHCGYLMGGKSYQLLYIINFHLTQI